MTEERSCLLRDGVPLLQQLALETGMMIQVVDLFWGVTEDVALDPEVYSVLLEQINYSRQYSAGPFFAVRLSHVVYSRLRLGRCCSNSVNDCCYQEAQFSSEIDWYLCCPHMWSRNKINSR